ncbi:MAG: hypothetical protein IPG24_12005 [Leptospiraceae bacterium]|nr:hypothetical protein [Leptospiraceae bacterium]
MENVKIDPMWYVLIVGYFILNFFIKYFIGKYKEERAATNKENPQSAKPPQGGDKAAQVAEIKNQHKEVAIKRRSTTTEKISKIIQYTYLLQISITLL